jgi:predicted PurR-regulated permease PerM
LKDNASSDQWSILQKQLAVLVLFLLSILLLYQVVAFFSDILRILGISILFAYLFIGLVDALQKFVHSRALAVFIVYFGVSAVVIVGVVLVVPALIFQVTQLLNNTYTQIPQWVESITQAVAPLQHRLDAAQIQIKVIDIVSSLVASIPHIEVGMLFTRLSDMAVSTMTWTMYGLSILVVSFYFLLDGYRMKNAIIRLFPKQHQMFLAYMATDLDQSMQAFFRGQIVLGLGFGALMVAVFSFLGVHFALLLGIVLGIWEIIPVIGPTIGFIPTLVAVGIDGMDAVPGNRLMQLVVVFTVFQGLQWLKDNIVAPRYIGNVIGLHPVVIFLAIMIGAKLDGMLGIIFALPAACAINVFTTHLHHNPHKLMEQSSINAAPQGDEQATEELAPQEPRVSTQPSST